MSTVPKTILSLSATLHNGRARLEGSRWIVILDRIIIAIRSWWIVIAHVSVVSSIERCCFSGVLAIQSHPPPSYWSIQSQFNIILTTANMILILRQSLSLLITRKRRSWWRKAIYNQGSTTQQLAAADNNASSKLLSLVSLSHWSHFQATRCGGVLIISNQRKIIISNQDLTTTVQISILANTVRWKWRYKHVWKLRLCLNPI